MTSLDQKYQWYWGLQLMGLLILFSAGCAKSQPTVTVIGERGGVEEAYVDEEIFEPMLPETTRITLGSFELMEVEDQLFHALIANFEGKPVEVISRAENLCLDIIAETDLDEDGFPDILLQNNEACSGRCCLAPYFVVSYRGNGQYKKSSFRGQAFREPKIERWKGKWTVVIENSPDATISTALLANQERFELNDGELVKVEEIVPQELNALTELRAKSFDSLTATDTLKLQFDLDADGKIDLIWGTFWKHWGRVMWSVQFANGTTMMDGTPFKRLGILPTKTEGYHDLVVDVDRVLEWTGKRYEERVE